MTETLDWVRSKSPRGIIDCYVNANPPEMEMAWSAADYLFQKSRSGAHSADGLLEHMDAHGIRRCLITPPPPEAGSDPEAGYRWTAGAVQRHPERLRLAVRFDPSEGMSAIRRLAQQVAEDGAVAVRVVPFRHSAPLTDPLYAPLFTKCVELRLPVTSTVGIPGPLVRAKYQDV
ncbi:MAG: amidohydrolase family protein, partial [Dehalococcoidia bacterium]